MSTWEAAKARIEEEAASPVSELGQPPSLIVVDHFDLSMIDLPPRGARLLVRPIARHEAVALVRECQGRVVVIAWNERGQGLLERELQLEPACRPQVTFGTRLLVVHQVKWNDIRWHIVEYEADGDGCIPQC